MAEQLLPRSAPAIESAAASLTALSHIAQRFVQRPEDFPFEFSVHWTLLWPWMRLFHELAATYRSASVERALRHLRHVTTLHDLAAQNSSDLVRLALTYVSKALDELARASYISAVKAGVLKAIIRIATSAHGQNPDSAIPF
ncbi:hypothetical protein C8R46DRAFT_1344634 [Mycena filopes]|nr:hypothetical protein C8R46DRAFT_1344634 [Mycena filopes]